MRKWLSLSVFALLLISTLFVSVANSAESSSKIRTVIEGPTNVLTGEKYTYTIRIEGLPNADKYGYSIEVPGGDADPKNGSSTNSSVFRVNVTAPPKEGEFTITVNGTADVGNTTYWNKVEYKVNAVKPYIIKANLYNSGSVEAKNVAVDLYIDGEFQYRAHVDIEPQKNKTVELKFNPLKFSDGIHDVRIEIDPSSNLTFMDNGKTEMTLQIYLGEMHEDHTSTWIALAILFGAGAVYSLLSYQKKKKRMKRRKW